MGSNKINVLGVVNKFDRSIEYDYLQDIDGVGGVKNFKNHLSQRVRYKRENSTIKDLLTEDKTEDEYNLYINELLQHLNIRKNGKKA
eukprot:TRINITY_DN148303_c0_g1_i1.p2 TRINITY_DN148303_c0_g1~~TRINITY_DN148303_c0_g1_i1.p2  ORF type:complete len:101 (+),score=5.81 TRINITY_DN148303_c0_g1_i1:44-304(+)